ncbi:hypothetical protein FRC15_007948 [Serendipita sp. 397]|nr:hypothetical protein FRC15_007948 [Serendipita sp. 397]
MDSRGVDDNSILLGGNMEDASLRPSEQETNPLDVFGIRITSEASASRASLASSVPMLPIIDAPGEFEWFDYSKCDRLDIGDGEEHNYSLSLSSGSVTNTLDTSMNDVLLEEVRSLTGGSQCDPLIPIVNGGEIEETMIEIGAPKISIGEQASTCSGVLDNATRTVPRSPAHDAYMCKSHSITSIPSIVIIDATPRQQFDFKDEAIRPPCVPESQRYPHNQIHSKPIPWINGYTPDEQA